MLVKELDTWINEKISLRKPNDAKIVEYAERMAEGVKFPPIKLGRWPVNEKYGEVGIVDGLHRVAAASQAKITEFDVYIYSKASSRLLKRICSTSSSVIFA